MKPKQILLMNELLTKMVQEVNPDYSVICDGTFYCDVDDMTISYSRNSKNIIEQMFADYIYNSYADVPQVSPFMLSILHELGHAETEDEMVDDSGAQFAFDRKENQSDEEFYAGFTKYYQLPNEQLATDWAVWFLQENTDECLMWDKRIKELRDAV